MQLDGRGMVHGDWLDSEGLGMWYSSRVSGYRDHDVASGASDQVVLQKSWDSIVGTSEADIRSDSVLYSSTVYSTQAVL